MNFKNQVNSKDFESHKMAHVYIISSRFFMRLKRSLGPIALVAVMISVIWGTFNPLSSLAAVPIRESVQNTQFLSSTPGLIAQNQAGEFALAPLPYAYEALEPYIDRETMTLHHDKHHAAYVRNLNAAIAKHPEWKGLPLESLLRNLDNLPEDIRLTVRNNGGGHANHTLFWQIMSPNSQGQPSGSIAQAINATFGDFGTFQEAFNTAGTGRFGSGWVWLVLTKDKTLAIMTTANQDSPLLTGNYPIMGNDLWEHAYYLNYRNRRGDYLSAWWNVVNWDEVNRRFEQAMNA